MKHCDECKRDRFPEGGIFLKATRWMCAACWTVKATRRKP